MKKKKVDKEPKKEGPTRAEVVIRKEFKESKRKDPINHDSLNCDTSKDHAERILSYGKERATILFKLHRWSNNWHHVDWKIVEEGVKTL